MSNRMSELAGACRRSRSAPFSTPVTGTLRSQRARWWTSSTRFPLFAETPPAVAELENALNRLDEAVADVRQINDTVRSADRPETADRLTNAVGQYVDRAVTGRVDSRLADDAGRGGGRCRRRCTALQATPGGPTAGAAVADLQPDRPPGLTLFLLWVIYSQVVLIRHHSRLLHEDGWQGCAGRRAPAAPPATALELSPLPAPTATPELTAGRSRP
ncbi:MAG: hypothetical protein V9H69_06870 [Anaerolineae bacterium]